MNSFLSAQAPQPLFFEGGKKFSHPLNFLLRDGSRCRHFRGIPSFRSQDRNQELCLSEKEQQGQFRDLTLITLRMLEEILKMLNKNTLWIF